MTQMVSSVVPGNPLGGFTYSDLLPVVQHKGHFQGLCVSLPTQLYSILLLLHQC